MAAAVSESAGGEKPPAFTPRDRDRAVADLERAIERLKAAPVQTPCAQCANFDAFTGGWCEYWDARVPAEAQPHGCEHWIEEIPF